MTTPCVICAAPIEQIAIQRFPRIPARKYCSAECRHQAFLVQSRESYARHREQRKVDSIGWQKANRERMRTTRATHRRMHPAKHREYAITSKYGLAAGEYERMLTEQGGVCAICGKDEKRIGRGGLTARLSIDHSHETGRVRGLLCAACNGALGWIEVPGWLDAALAYLRSTEREGKAAQAS